MKKDQPKRRGDRPATGLSPIIPTRFPTDLLRRVESIATRNLVSRSAAVRMLVVRGLEQMAGAET